jgi:hypothetical protein
MMGILCIYQYWELYDVYIGRILNSFLSRFSFCRSPTETRFGCGVSPVTAEVGGSSRSGAEQRQTNKINKDCENIST